MSEPSVDHDRLPPREPETASHEAASGEPTPNGTSTINPREERRIEDGSSTTEPGGTTAPGDAGSGGDEMEEMGETVRTRRLLLWQDLYNKYRAASFGEGGASAADETDVESLGPEETSLPGQPDDFHYPLVVQIQMGDRAPPAMFATSVSMGDQVRDLYGFLARSVFHNRPGEIPQDLYGNDGQHAEWEVEFENLELGAPFINTLRKRRAGLYGFWWDSEDDSEEDSEGEEEEDDKEEEHKDQRKPKHEDSSDSPSSSSPDPSPSSSEKKKKRPHVRDESDGMIRYYMTSLHDLPPDSPARTPRHAINWSGSEEEEDDEEDEEDSDALEGTVTDAEVSTTLCATASADEDMGDGADKEDDMDSGDDDNGHSDPDNPDDGGAAGA
ncbi:hypothetical protein GE09DRAFT_1229029 [Coniochaeta sp. 2T2.1]|nr:hypothetical protein GE09DRAFT_1229029 [Coniochaeta sp. 2T2.1]